MTLHMLSTSDNPFNPTTEFDEWYAWDTRAGYHTMAYLARVVSTSHELSDADQDLAIELAIDEIVEMNLTQNYIKVEVDPSTDYPDDPALAVLVSR